VMAEYGKDDAAFLRSARTAVVPNGVPDPCPDYALAVRPLREARAAGRAQLLATGSASGQAAGAAGSGFLFYEVLFLSLCTREKGLFDAVEAVILLNRGLAAKGAPLRARLNVAGKFMFDRERAEFEQRIRAPELQWSPSGPNAGPAEPLVRYCGFVSGDAKGRLFRENDCFCFPSYYSAESFGIVLVEAMAFGLDIVTTRWRSIPELLPGGYPGIVEPKSPAQIAAACERFLAAKPNPALRERFLAHYTAEKCAQGVRAALMAIPRAAPRFSASDRSALSARDGNDSRVLNGAKPPRS
jgi:glycosyltransferase involved in cell wall biosynthesis